MIGKKKSGRAASDVNAMMQASLDTEKVWILRRVVRFLKEGGRSDSRTVLEELTAYIKARLLAKEILREISLYGEPVHTVEEVLRTVEAEDRFREPLSEEDLELVSGFLRGLLLKADPRGDMSTDDCVRVLLDQINGVSDLVFDDERFKRPLPDYHVEKYFMETETPDLLGKCYLKIEENKKEILTLLLKFSKFDLNEKSGLSGSAGVEWLREYIEADLSLVTSLRYIPALQEERALPALLAECNVEEKLKPTVCLLGYLSAPCGGEVKLDGTYTGKRLYSRNAHLIKAPLAAHLAALRALRNTESDYPFNVKLVLLPSVVGDERRLRRALAGLEDFLWPADYCLLANGVDHLSRAPAVVESAVGQRVYSLAVHLPADHRAFWGPDRACVMDRLKIILYDMMDRIRQYNRLNKHKKNMSTILKGIEVEQTPPAMVEFGGVENVATEIPDADRKISAVGWRTTVVIKNFIEKENVIVALTEDDILNLKSSLTSKDTILPDCYFEFSLVSSCREYSAGERYYSDQLGRFVRTAYLRATGRSRVQEARAASALPLPRVIQKLFKKETMILSFGGVEEFGHHAVTFSQFKEAVMLSASLLVGLRLEGLAAGNAQRGPIRVKDVLRLLELPIAIHLEQPFLSPEERLGERLFRTFQESLEEAGAGGSTSSDTSLAACQPTRDPGLAAVYLSLEQGRRFSVQCPFTDRIARQREYLRFTKDLMLLKGSLGEREFASLAVSFLLLLFFKKRRSDIICKFCEVTETCFKDLPPISPLFTSEDEKFKATSCVAKSFEIPTWVSLGDGFELLSEGGSICGKGFTDLIREVIYNIMFDGEPGSPVDRLFNVILFDKKIARNNIFSDKIVGYILSRNVNIISQPGIGKIHFKVNKYPFLMKFLPKRTYNFDKRLNVFSKSLVTAEELKSYLLLDTIRCYYTDETNKSSAQYRSSTSEQDTDPCFEYLQKQYSEGSEDSAIEKDDVIDDEYISINPYYAKQISVNQIIPYRHSPSWYKAYMYLIEISKSGIQNYNILWKLYKEKLRKLRANATLKQIFQDRQEDETIDEATLYYLKTYVKYWITVLQYCFPLYWNLEDLYRLYYVKPEFLFWESYYILRDILPFPSQPPNTLPNPGTQLSKVKSSRGSRMSLAKDGGRREGSARKETSSRTPVAKESISRGTSASTQCHWSSGNWTEDEGVCKGIPVSTEEPSTTRDGLETTDMLCRDGRNVTEANKPRAKGVKSSTLVENSRRYETKSVIDHQSGLKEVLRRRGAVLQCLMEARTKWWSSKSSDLKEFENILLLCIDYWDSYDNSDPAESHRKCCQVYEKTMFILEKVGSSTDEQPKIPKKLKAYPLREKKNQLCLYYAQKIKRNKRIFEFLDKQRSPFCKRPRDYYKRITQCYTAIRNMITTITKLEADIGDVVPLPWVKNIKKRFLFLPGVTF